MPLHIFGSTNTIQLVVLVSDFVLVSTLRFFGQFLNCLQFFSMSRVRVRVRSWTTPGMQNFVTIGSGVSVPQIRDFAVLLG